MDDRFKISDKKNKDYNLIFTDVGGAIWQTKGWMHISDNHSFVFYFIDVSQYNQVIYALEIFFLFPFFAFFVFLSFVFLE